MDDDCPGRAPDIVGAQQLLDEHRVAGRALEQAVHQRGLRPLPEQGGDLVGDLGAVEPLHLDPIEPPAVRDRQRADQVGLVIAGRGDDDQRDLARSACEVLEDRDGRPVRPVNVVDDQQRRRAGRAPRRPPR